MATNYISIRVLQHDKESDQIRIGAERGIFEDQMDRLVQDTIAQYEQRTEWCGGFQVACERYYKRIAIVEADSLAVLRVIHPVKEEEYAMGVIKDVIMQTLKEQGVQAEWVGDKPRRIQSSKQAKYADLRQVEKGYIQGVHKARKEANNGSSGSK